MTGRLKLGELLLAEGLISEFQLQAALGEQSRWGNRLGETLVHMGFLGEQELVRALSRRFQLPGVDLEGKSIDPEVLSRVPRDVAEKSGCLPLFVQREKGLDVLYLGMDDPTDLGLLDELSFRTGLRVKAVVAGPLQLRRAVAAHYRGVSRTPPLERARGTLTEAALPPEDTAPLLPDDARPVLEPPPELPAPPPPALPASPPPASGSVREDAAAAAPRAPQGPAEKPRQVATRDILRALVHLLIERELISREDLLRAVRDVSEEGPAG